MCSSPKHIPPALKPVQNSVIAALFSLVLCLITRFFTLPTSTLFWCIAYGLLGLAAYLVYRAGESWGLSTDLCVIVPFIWWVTPGINRHTPLLVFLPLIAAIWIIAANRLSARFTVPAAWAGPLVWSIASFTPFSVRTWLAPALTIGSTLLMLIVYTIVKTSATNTPLKHIDCIVSSYSGNTGHFAHMFITGVQQTGAAVTVHRFHRFKSFEPVLNGQGLMIAFPVYGCKPPWPLLNYFLFKLPKGNGKPAFITYTCIGGAENAGFFCWLILLAKGYRVTGRSMGVYPLNVPTFRLGPQTLWKWLDCIVPVQRDMALQTANGRAFASGRSCGDPFLPGLTPAWLIGILLDNRFLDRLLYHNHVIKRRCTGCGLCIDICPAQRLSIHNGYPRSRGDCMICMACVNICPHNAMHLWCWTEYGRRYPPRFESHLFKIRD